MGPKMWQNLHPQPLQDIVAADWHAQLQAQIQPHAHTQAQANSSRHAASSVDAAALNAPRGDLHGALTRSSGKAPSAD